MIKGKLVSAYLIHSYLYYVCNMSIISDAEYDEICAELLKQYDEIEHVHKHLVSKEALKAGTGYHISVFDYPSRVKIIAMHLREDPMYLDKLHKKWDGKPAPASVPVEVKPATKSGKVSNVQGSLLSL